MKVQVIKIEDAKLKSYTGINFTYKPEPYQGKEKEEVTRFIFGNQKEIVDAVKSLKVGDWADLSFEKNGKYQNLVSVVKIDAPSEPSGKAEQSTAYPQRSNYNNEETQRRISRSAAMKEATTIVLSKATKTTEIEAIIGDIKAITRELESFLNFADEVKELNDFEQPAFSD